jgi:predicted nucleic acid-binding protein
MGQVNIRDIEDGVNIALDTVVFVYFLERHIHHFPIIKKLFHRIEKGQIKGLMSSLVYTELLIPAYRAGRSDLAMQTFNYLSRFPNLATVSVLPPISREAARLRATYNLRTPDALHAATALHQKADLILTNDKHFKRILAEMPVAFLDESSSL